MKQGHRGGGGGEGKTKRNEKRKVQTTKKERTPKVSEKSEVKNRQTSDILYIIHITSIYMSLCQFFFINTCSQRLD